MIFPILALGAVLHCVTAAPVTGSVMDASGAPVAGAAVFLEADIQAPLEQTQSGADGRFAFDDAHHGGVGFFAIAPGYAFGGAHRNITVGGENEPINIVLYPPATLTLEVADHKGRAIQGAAVTRIGLLGAEKVGIPLSKLESIGLAIPMSNAEGRLTLDHLPQNGSVDIKLGHADYAQEGIIDVPVAKSVHRATLYTGVRVEGHCISRGEGIPVARATILIRNAQPPHDTAITTTDSSGSFAIRLKPGVYIYQAAGVALRSPGWERLTVTGELPQPRAKLIVAGVGEIRGEVRDAVTSAPIEGARLALESFGNPADVVRTGPTGEYRFTAAEGPNIVRLELAPGYYPPQSQTMEVLVQQGQSAEAPGLWLKPLPGLSLQAVDEDGAPVAGALVSLLRPEQLGWYTTDANGMAEFHVQNYPAGDFVYGNIQSRDGLTGAVFRHPVSAEAPARIQMLPWNTVTGTVRNTKGKPVEGAVVGAVYPGEAKDDPLLLWRVLSGSDGRFTWTRNVPGVPLRCAALDGAGRSGLSNLFNGGPGSLNDVGEMVIPEGESAGTLLGKNFDWSGYTRLCGAAPDKDRPTAIFFCTPSALPTLREGVGSLGSLAVQTVYVVSAAVPCGPTAESLFQGLPPGAATTLILERGGVVALETMGLPPVALLLEH